MQGLHSLPGFHQMAETIRSTGWKVQQYFAADDYESANPASISWNLNLKQVRLLQLNANTTIAFPTHLKRGGTYILFLKQDSTGSRTMTWTDQAAALGTGTWKWSGGSAPTLTTTAGKIYVLSFVSDGTHMFGSSVLNF